MRAIIIGTLLVLGCGGSDATEVTLPEPGRLYEESEVWPAEDAQSAESAPVLVDALDNQGERVEFWHVGEDGGEPVVMLTAMGPATAPRIGLRRDQDASPAEIWQALTTREIPEVVARDHRRVRTLEGRSLEVRDVDLSPGEADTVQKATAVQLAMFPLRSGTCWRQVATGTAILDAAHPKAWVCSLTPTLGVGSIAALPINFSLGGGPVECPETKEAIRNVVYNGDASGAARSVQMCYVRAPGDRPCLPGVLLQPQAYYGSDYPKTTLPHLLYTQALYPTNEGGSDAFQFGAARQLKNELPQFQSPQCLN